MPNAGDYYEIELKNTHLNWGTYRKTASRERITGEHFIPVPRAESKRLGIYNKIKGTGVGNNEFYARSADGYYSGMVKISGNNEQGDSHGKNIAESGNLKGFHDWFVAMNMKVGTRIRVEWISSTEILFTVL
ncbi:hypothetical protein P7G51_11415 [Enterococcus asini]|uniref:hypothetical protein n=1 Tax=Enterococcus asini TaxID=57732 RepID=UPI00288DED05|nr:hypothetical protein [Enterococcus asini]MDT2757990.1 hypothetical protein [Enterococcus asini]